MMPGLLARNTGPDRFITDSSLGNTMETTNLPADNLPIVIAVLASVAAFGIGSMVWAYNGAGSRAVLFREVMPVPKDLNPDATDRFQQGIGQYLGGHYRQAIDCFNQVLVSDPELAAAYHNRGLCLANLRQDDGAVLSLLKAADLYLVRADRDSVALIKQQVLALRQRKLAREQR
jgi:tetratricopeptide (TPR) repeat protein